MFGLAERRPNLLGAKDAHRRGINEVSGGEAAGELLERGIAAINGDVVEKLMLTGAGDMKLLPSGRSVVEAVIETRRTDFAWCFSRETRITCVEAWCREAAEAEDQKIVEMLMSEGADIDKLLMAVANDGDEAAAKTLIAAGANEGGGLHEAIRSGKIQAVNTLLAAGVSPEAPDENGKTPLQAAMECGRAAAAKTLVEAGAEGGEERLNAAIRSGDIQGAKVLLGASIGGDALRVAVRGRDAKAAKILIAAGCDPNAKDANGQTPLHVAGANLDANTYKILLDGGANHKAVDAEGKTPPEVWAEANNKNARLAGGRGSK
jgi:hypothetical protein